jgi:hypothetical protein
MNSYRMQFQKYMDRNYTDRSSKASDLISFCYTRDPEHRERNQTNFVMANIMILHAVSFNPILSKLLSACLISHFDPRQELPMGCSIFSILSKYLHWTLLNLSSIWCHLYLMVPHICSIRPITYQKLNCD